MTQSSKFGAKDLDLWKKIIDMGKWRNCRLDPFPTIVHLQRLYDRTIIFAFWSLLVLPYWVT